MTPRNAQFAILYIDIDEFKRINDSLGHLIGDEFLKGVAERLRQSVGPDDFIARLGGDEFAIVQRNVTCDDDVSALLARIYDALRTPFDCNGHRLSSDASIGVAIAPRHGSDLFGLLKSADLAMYAAKAAGRRTYRFFEPTMEKQANLRRELESDLRMALVEGGFELHYQPLVDLRNDDVTGCEALLRWRHPLRGMISPADFIPVAEETGLIEEIGQWVLRTACAEAATWPAHVRIAVNVSPIQFRSQTLSLKVAAALAETGLDPRRLELEITEAVLIADDDAALVALNQLRALGVHIALDDFGTGYSSLQYLQRFPFDKIKIDRSFVKEVTRNSSSASIIRAVVSIAADRNMITTAEGVETLQQRETVQNLGCTQMQGYLFSAARPAHEIRALLASCPVASRTPHKGVPGPGTLPIATRSPAGADPCRQSMRIAYLCAALLLLGSSLAHAESRLGVLLPWHRQKRRDDVRAPQQAVREQAAGFPRQDRRSSAASTTGARSFAAGSSMSRSARRGRSE